MSSRTDVPSCEPDLNGARELSSKQVQRHHENLRATGNPSHTQFGYGGRSVRRAFVYSAEAGFRFMRNATDIIRTVSRHTLAYMLFSISELFRLYDEFDPLDLLIVHAILNPPRPAARRRQRAG
jgi:hypothetical protein